MRKQPNIAWRKSQTESLSKAVRKINAKITRESKKNPEFIDYLPERHSVEELRESIKTNKDLQRYLRSVERAFKPEAFTPVLTDKGIMTTKYEIEETKLGVRRINRQRKKELEKAELSPERGTMGAITSNNLRPKNFNIDTITPRDFKALNRLINKEGSSTYLDEKEELYKKNYIELAENVLGSEAKELIEIIEGIDPKLIYGQYYKDPVLQIGFFYSLEPPEVMAEVVVHRWKLLLEKEEQ